MKKSLRWGLVVGGVLCATGFLARGLLTELRVPAMLPESFWQWVGALFGVEDAEGQVALEVWMALGVSLGVTSLSTAVLGWSWRRWRDARRQAQAQSGDRLSPPPAP